MVRTPVEFGEAGRDLRIDFFRGLALFMIIFDHIPGDPLSRFTYARLGFSDAAEIFVFLSGVSCGIVYFRIVSRQGVCGLLRSVSLRTLQIYAYYLLASLLTILLIVASRDLISIPDNHQAFIALREDPLAAIRSAIFLVSPPDLPGILVLYLELTFFFIPLFILITEWTNATAALVLSGSLWLLAQIRPDLLPRLADHSYFNPIAWQFIFCIGMFVGTWYNSTEISVESFRQRSWVLLACAIASAGLAYHFASILTHHQLLNLGQLAMSDATVARMKENLSAIRLLHFLAVTFLVAICMRPSSSILSAPGAAVIVKVGKASLQVFCLGAILSVMLNLFVAIDRPGSIERLILDCAVVLLIAWFATTMAQHRWGRVSNGGRVSNADRQSAGRSQATSEKFRDAPQETSAGLYQNFRRMLTNLMGQKSPIGGSRPAVRWIGWK